MTATTESGRCVYGLRVLGLDKAAELSADQASIGGELTVEVRQLDAPAPPLAAVDAQRGVRLLADGRHLALRRNPATATFFGTAIDLDLLAHPYLAPVATAFNRWAGREVFHAGAFVVGERAWAVLGLREAGKSSLLAALAARGVPVLTDDIVVTDGVVAYAGPRCVDLREPLPHTSLDAVRVRHGTRLRLPLPPVESQVPLGGWLFLSWGRQSQARVTADVLLARLAYRRGWSFLPSDPVTLFQLATLPAWDLTRPRDWNALPGTVERLVATLTEHVRIGIPA